MIISYKLEKDKEIEIPIIQVDVLVKECKIRMYEANVKLTEEERDFVLKTHRIFLPGKKVEETMVEGNRFVIYVPQMWNVESIENYIQAFLDEYLLSANKVENSKDLDELLKQFSLEILVF